jgi:hypothetical protein
MGDATGKDTLDDVCSVEAVHAVGAHDTLLLVQDFASLRSYRLVETLLQLGSEAPELEQRLVDLIKQP